MCAVELISLLPALRNCHVRLSRRFKPQLYQILQSTALHARRMSKYPSQASISCATRLLRPLASKASGHEVQMERRLFALPRELRFRILDFSDLIIPRKEVNWSRYPSNKVFHPDCLDTQGMSCRPTTRHGCRFFNSWAATKRQRPSNVGVLLWMPPSALFLVSDLRNYSLYKFAHGRSLGSDS